MWWNALKCSPLSCLLTLSFEFDQPSCITQHWGSLYSVFIQTLNKFAELFLRPTSYVTTLFIGGPNLGSTLASSSHDQMHGLDFHQELPSMLKRWSVHLVSHVLCLQNHSLKNATNIFSYVLLCATIPEMFWTKRPSFEHWPANGSTFWTLSSVPKLSALSHSSQMRVAIVYYFGYLGHVLSK